MIRDKEHFLQLVEKYTEGFGSALYNIDGVIYGTFDLYKQLMNYMKVNNITTITLPSGIGWDELIKPKHHYFIECTAFKKSGKHYSSSKVEVLQSDKPMIEDFPILYEKKEELMLNLDAACGLNKDSIKQNQFTVLIQILDLNADEQICYQYLIHP